MFLYWLRMKITVCSEYLWFDWSLFNDLNSCVTLTCSSPLSSNLRSPPHGWAMPMTSLTQPTADKSQQNHKSGARCAPPLLPFDQAGVHMAPRSSQPPQVSAPICSSCVQGSDGFSWHFCPRFCPSSFHSSFLSVFIFCKNPICRHLHLL